MGYNILIVDDSKTVRAVLRRAIEIAGIPTESLHDAGNGLEALELLSTQAVDIILTDIHMPEMNGVELLSRVRKSERHAKLPVVVVSSDSSEERHEQLETLGVHAILSKPFRPENIRDVINSALGEDS